MIKMLVVIAMAANMVVLFIVGCAKNSVVQGGDG